MIRFRAEQDVAGEGPLHGPRRQLWRVLRGGRVGISLVISSVVLTAATLVSGLMVLRWVPPSAMGVWQTLLLAQTYLQLVRAGVVNGLNREFPYRIGQGDVDVARRLAAAAQAYVVVTSVGVALVYALALATMWDRGSTWRIGLAAMAVGALMGFYIIYVQATCRSAEEFHRLSLLQYGQAVVVLTAPLLVYRWGFSGLAGHYVIQMCATAIWAHAIRPLRVRPRLESSALGILVRTGLPLFVTSYMFAAAMGFDRLILLTREGPGAVGLYTPAAWVLTASGVIPGALATYVYPQMTYRFGQTHDRHMLWRPAVAAIAVAVAVGVPIAAAAVLVVPWAMQVWFPEYLPAVTATRLAALSGLLLMSPIPGTAVLRSIGAWAWLYLYMGTLLVSKWVFPWSTRWTGNPLTDVAAGSVVASVVAAVVAIGSCYLATHAPGHSAERPRTARGVGS